MRDRQSSESVPAPTIDAEVVEDLTPSSGRSPGEETVDGVPVLAEVRAIEPVRPASLPAVQAAAAAATGFVAGAAALALVRRHSARKLARESTAPELSTRCRSSAHEASWSTST